MSVRQAVGNAPERASSMVEAALPTSERWIRFGRGRARSMKEVGNAVSHEQRASSSQENPVNTPFCFAGRSGDACRRNALPWHAVCLVWLAIISIGKACDTPVYRYAMYRWNPAPYEVYYFHDQPVTDDDRALHALIEQVSEKRDAAANLSLIPVDLARDPDLKTVPPDIRKLWKSIDPKALPSYLVWAPPSRDRRQDHGAIISGALDSATLQALIHSPARDQVARQLETGKAGVLLLLGGKDDAETARARQVAEQLVDGLSSGKLSLLSSPPADPAEEGKPGPTPPQVGLQVIDRQDVSEQWLIKTLFAVEDGLQEIDKPMIFPIFGRGRVLPPYIGAGITQELLVECLEFIAGPCSCTVKEQNRGMDLLLAYNWDAAADKLAEQFGAEEGNESVIGAEDFFPELIIPAGSPIADGDSPADSAETVVATVADVSATDDDAPAVATAAPVQIDTTGVPSPPSPQPATENTAAASDSIATGNMLWTVGGGVGIALFTLFVATFVVLRPR
ncbi:MAG: hypothetical protein CMJ59_03405 [Planctomycetaceae bacterium]|nr:hypothetical protein [Planctomycetaceae bacterium]